MTVKPETIRQAETWERTKNAYRTRGICWSCSAQAAYGHQLGFLRVVPPCNLCAQAIALLPKIEANGWRSQSVSSSATWRTARPSASTTAPGGVAVHPEPHVAPGGAPCVCGDAA